MHGLILLDKPAGITSFGAVARVRRLLGKIKVGHTGTLDPMATGVLPILIGRATTLSSLLTDRDKRYTAGIKLGITTDTQDITGKILTTSDVDVSRQQLETVIADFKGEILQTPPMYSAVKQDGVRLYKLARQGVEIQRPPRKISVHRLDILEKLDCDHYLLDIHCSKGTYVRTLINDIGQKLGCGATLTSLRRTMTAGFNIDRCVTLEILEQNEIQNHILPSDRAVLHYPKVNVTLPQAVRFCNGGGLFLNRLKIKNFADGDLIRVYHDDNFIGMGLIDLGSGLMKIRCIISKIDLPDDN